MTETFDDLLTSLGKVIGIALHADRTGACAVRVKKNIVVQLQPDDTREKLLMISRVAEVGPGKFREEVLKETLKANGMPEPKVGSFAFVPKSNHLILFQYYPIDILTGERLAGLLFPFVEFAEKWKEAISNNKPSPQVVNLPPMGLIR